MRINVHSRPICRCTPTYRSDTAPSPRSAISLLVLQVSLLKIREKELQFYTQNCIAIGTQAALLSGFAYNGIIQVRTMHAMRMGGSASRMVFFFMHGHGAEETSLLAHDRWISLLSQVIG